MALSRVNDVALVVASSGRGEPVVLVHGSWDDSQVWTQVATGLADGFHVVRYDRRGHGGSSDSPIPGSRRDDEDDLAAVIETVVSAPAHVVGTSFGASIALGLAARRTDLFRTLCVHEPPLLSLVGHDPAVAELRDTVAEVVERIVRGEAEGAARTFVELLVGPGAWEAMPPGDRSSMCAHAATFAGEQNDPVWADIDLDGLQQVGFPVLLTSGDQSPPMFSAIIAALAEGIAASRVMELPRVGHVPHQTQPAAYSAAVRAFVAGR